MGLLPRPDHPRPDHQLPHHQLHHQQSRCHGTTALRTQTVPARGSVVIPAEVRRVTTTTSVCVTLASAPREAGVLQRKSTGLNQLPGSELNLLYSLQAASLRLRDAIESDS